MTEDPKNDLPEKTGEKKKPGISSIRMLKRVYYWLIFGFILAVFILFAVLAARQVHSVLGPPASGLNPFAKLSFTYRLYGELDQLNKPFGTADKTALVEVNEGNSASMISELLYENGLISNPQILTDYMVYTGDDRLLLAGKFPLNAGMTVPEISRALTNAQQRLIKLTILSGMRVEEIADLLPADGMRFTRDDLIRAAHNYPVSLHPAQTTSLEGYFLPGVYEINRNISLDSFLAGFVKEFDRNVTQEMRDAFTAQGLTLNQAVTMASMVAREAVSPEEYGKIASVFYNRIASGMSFDCDPTVQYALGWDDAGQVWWKNPLSADDLLVNSPYNTYRNKGFPPGPICSPSLEVLNAVAHPEKTGYLYFQAKCDGTPYHNFAETYEEHIANSCR